MRALILKQWFVLALLASVVLAFSFPEWGASGGVLRSEITSKIGIVLIFFFQGWMLPTEILSESMRQWKTHLFTQVFIFMVFPSVVIVGDLVWGPFVSDPLRIGFLFLAVLPTTVTSAIIYTSQAEGRAGVALVNTTVANVAGVIITPLWMAVLVKAGKGEMGDLNAVFLTLSKLILIPFFVGQLVRIFWKSILSKLKTAIGYFNQLVIVFIVFAAFSNSVSGGVWVGQVGGIIFLTLAICLLIFLVVNFLCSWLLGVFKLAAEDQVAIVFCGTQKTLAAAVPLGISLFGEGPMFGLILLPVLIYHPIQLIAGAFQIGYFRKKVTG